MKKWITALMMSLTFFVSAESEVKAAEMYDVIFQEVHSYNENARESSWIASAILYAADTYEVDPILITAVMESESGFNFRAVSPIGALGLMQLMPETAQMLGVNPYNALENVLGGTLYLKNQLNRFSNYGRYSVTNAVAAYNAGPQAVINAGGVPNYAETRQYVVNVASNYQKIFQQIS